MRYPFLIFVTVSMAGWSSSARCDDGSSGDPPVLPDPSLATSIYIPSTAATAGVADTRAASHAGMRILVCSKINPCAMATPAAASIAPAH